MQSDKRSTSSPRRASAPACAVTWWGHASVEICLDGVRLVTDPLLRRRIGPLHSVGYRPGGLQSAVGGVDAVLLSHLHRDHTDLPSIRRFGAHTRVIAPSGAGRLVRGPAQGPVEELPVGASTSVGSVRIQATDAVHDGRRHLGGVAADAVGYLLRGSRSVYFAGDTDVFDAMAELVGDLPHGLDVALLPVSGWGLTLGPGHMDADAAARALRLLRPRVAIPVHWGTLRIPVVWRVRPGHNVEAPHRFAELAARVAPGTTVVVPVPGRPLALPVS